MRLTTLALLVVASLCAIGVVSASFRNNSPCPNGPIWHNPKGYRCFCQSYRRKAYYECDATTGTTTTTSTTTTTTTSPTTTTSTTTTTAATTTEETTTAATTTEEATTADTTTAETTTDAAPAAGVQSNESPCPRGSIWTNRRGQRCYCQQYNHFPYYNCGE